MSPDLRVPSSLAATRHHRSAAHLNRGLRYGLSVAVVGPGRSPWHTAPPPFPLATRLLSTSVKPPTGNPETSDGTQSVISAAPRKPKVELRPAPVKPSKPAPSPAPVSASTPTQAEAPALSPSTSAQVSTTPHPHETVVEAAKHDFEDASQHGILLPPPEGASWPRRMFHQLKELFVRISRSAFEF